MKKKKAFTLLELVIVIAVIAILAAVLIPTFGAIIKRSKISKDTMLVKNLNLAAKAQEELDGKPENYYDALQGIMEQGFIIENLTPTTTGAEIYWDINTNRYALFEGENVIYKDEGTTLSTGYELWKISATYTENETHSVLLRRGSTLSSINASTGIDVGDNIGIDINYTKGAEAKDNVVIRTNGGKLTITASTDTVKHFGYADEVNIVSIKTTSYHEFGTVPFLEIANGRVVLEKDSKVSHIHLDRKTETQFDNIIIKKTADVQLPSFSRDSMSTALTEAILVVEIQSESVSEFIWLDGNGTIEDEKVLVSSSFEGAKVAVTEQNASDTAKQVANSKVGESVIDAGVDKEATKTAVIDNYYSGESNPTNIPAGTYAYYSLDGELVTMTSDTNFFTQDFFDVIEDGLTVTICRDMTFSDAITIANKNITIKGVSTKPSLTAKFLISHTSGGHTVEFKNINFNVPHSDYAIKANSYANATTVNVLKVDNCGFYVTNSSAGSCITLNVNGGVVSTQLIATGNVFKTDSYDELNKTGYRQVAITANHAGGNNLTGDNYQLARHTIDGNIFLGKLAYAFVGGYADFTNNIVDLQYYNGSALTKNAYRAFQLRGATLSNNGGQCDIVIANNTFKNLNEVFKLYTLDTIVDLDTSLITLYGAEGEKKNTFENVSKLGSADSSASAMLTKHGIIWGSEHRVWTGVTNPSITVLMDKINMSLEGELETGYMTLSNGTQIKTYTQVINPADGRTGFSITDENNTKYWYYASFNLTVNYFIKDGTNEIYVGILGGGNDCTSIRVKDTTNGWPTNDNGTTSEPDWLNDHHVNAAALQAGYKYFDGTGTSKVAAFYKSGITISTDSFGNTYFNGTVSESGNVITVSSANSTSLNIAVAYIGSYNKLSFTRTAGNDANTLYIVTPETIGQISLGVSKETTINTNAANILVKKALTLNVLADNTISASLIIDGASAIGTVLNNSASIRKVGIYARTTLTNDGTITSVHIGAISEGSVDARDISAANAKNSVITNNENATINGLYSFTKMTLTNNGTLNDMMLTVASSTPKSEENAKDSYIVNNGAMCVTPRGYLELDVKCTFINNGTIGVEGRGISVEHSTDEAESNCDMIGGIINIGYYGVSNLHDGLVFTNNGIIYTGARHNGHSHQPVTFWLHGYNHGETGVTMHVTINNGANGVIYGENWKTNYKNSVVVDGTANLAFY